MVFPVIQTSSELERAEAEEAPPLPPLSLANLLEEGIPRPCFRKTQIKPQKLKSTDSSPFCAYWSEKNNTLIKLWSNVSGFLTTGPRVRDDVVQVSCGNLLPVPRVRDEMVQMSCGNPPPGPRVRDEMVQMSCGNPPPGSRVRDDVVQVSCGNLLPVPRVRDEMVQMSCGNPPPVPRVKDEMVQMSCRNPPPVPRVRDEMVQLSCGYLPLELWGEIGKRLNGRLDILRFRSMCKQWRSSLPPPTRFPLWVPGAPSNIPPTDTLLPPGTCSYLAGYVRKVRCVITEVSLYTCKGENKGILLVEDLDQSGKFGAFWCRAHNKCKVKRVKFEHRMISLTKPPWSTRLSFLSKAYHLRIAFFRFDSRYEIVRGKWNLHYNKGVNKMVMISSNGDDGVNPNYVGASNLIVIALLSSGRMKGRLALLRLEGSPENWVWETDFCTLVFEDIATYRGKLCALDASGRVLVMDYCSLQMTQLSPPWPFFSELKSKYLFEYRGNLYLADLHNRKKKKDFQFKLSVPLQKWIEDKDEKQLAFAALIPFLVRDGVTWA